MPNNPFNCLSRHPLFSRPPFRAQPSRTHHFFHVQTAAGGENQGTQSEKEVWTQNST